MYRSQDEWRKLLLEEGYLWVHDGNPARPHPEITSGNHTDRYFNSRLLFGNPSLFDEAASDLLDLYANTRYRLDAVNCVVGPQKGATILAKVLSEKIQRRCRWACTFASPAKCGEGISKRMVFDPSCPILPEWDVLLCEDTVNTWGSVALTEQAVHGLGAETLPYILSVWNRSGFTKKGDKSVIALVEWKAPIWSKKRCPLCAKGSRAIGQPKKNWDEFIRPY